MQLQADYTTASCGAHHNCLIWSMNSSEIFDEYVLILNEKSPSSPPHDFGLGIIHKKYEQ